MGQTTPNMGIYIPSAGETNYEQSFAAGMMNIDQHDHSGGPNKGVPITNSGLADFSVTYDKLNANVVDPTTGIGTQGGAFQNRLQLLGYLANLYQLSLTPGVGFVVMNGGVSDVRTFQNSATITWNNANGAGNPSADVNIGGLTPVVVANGGTGRTSFTPYGILVANTTATGAIQQVSGTGTIGQSLVSQGAGAFPIWSNNFIQPTRPAFSARVNTNSGGVTGNGAHYQIAFQETQFDQGGNFTTGSGALFTAPTAGIYYFNLALQMQVNTSSSADQLQVDFYLNGAQSGRRQPSYFKFDDLDDSSGFVSFTTCLVLQLSANDTVYPVFTCTGSSNNTAVQVNANTLFQGYQIC